MARRRKRVVLRVEFSKKGVKRYPYPGWILSGQFMMSLPRVHQTWWYPTQAGAIRNGRYYGHRIHDAGRLSQLVVHGKSGRILWESTYGKDPKAGR